MDSLMDDLIDNKPAIAVIANPEQKREEDAQRICSEVLRGLGYEVKKSDPGNGVDLLVNNGKTTYSLSVAFCDPQSETHLRIPVAAKDAELPHIFNMKADCIAFYQEKYEGGTVIQFRLNDLKELIKPLVDKHRQNMSIAFHARNAIEMNKLHVHFREDVNGYIFYLYLPIESVCKQIKHSKKRSASK